jgi:hypothetical protein
VSSSFGFVVREADAGVKPGAQAPSEYQYDVQAREAGESGVALARSAGSWPFFCLDPGAHAPGFMLSPAAQVRVLQLEGSRLYSFHAEPIQFCHHVNIY